MTRPTHNPVSTSKTSKLSLLVRIGVIKININTLTKDWFLFSLLFCLGIYRVISRVIQSIGHGANDGMWKPSQYYASVFLRVGRLIPTRHLLFCFTIERRLTIMDHGLYLYNTNQFRGRYWEISIPRSKTPSQTRAILTSGLIFPSTALETGQYYIY